MITLRRPVETDLPRFREIADTYSENPLVDKFETAAVVELNDKIVGFGVTRTLLEAVLYCDGRPREKVVALKELMEAAKIDARSMKHSQIYAFIPDEDYAEILRTKFGFKDAKGICLVLDLGDSNGKSEQE